MSFDFDIPWWLLIPGVYILLNVALQAYLRSTTKKLISPPFSAKEVQIDSRYKYLELDKIRQMELELEGLGFKHFFDYGKEESTGQKVEDSCPSRLLRSECGLYTVSISEFRPKPLLAFIATVFRVKNIGKIVEFTSVFNDDCEINTSLGQLDYKQACLSNKNREYISPKNSLSNSFLWHKKRVSDHLEKYSNLELVPSSKEMILDKLGDDLKVLHDEYKATNYKLSREEIPKYQKLIKLQERMIITDEMLLITAPPKDPEEILRSDSGSSNQSLYAPPSTFADPLSTNSPHHISKSHIQPGLSRLSFIITNVVLLVLISLLTYFINFQNGSNLGNILYWVIWIVFAITIGLRLKNLAMQQLWFWGILVPGLNFWLMSRLICCPAGYEEHKTLDRAGLVLTACYWIIIVSLTVLFLTLFSALIYVGGL